MDEEDGVSNRRETDAKRNKNGILRYEILLYDTRVPSFLFYSFAGVLI